jgi:hypothetical protein
MRASLLAQVQIMEHLIPMLTHRKAEQARLRRQKQALKTAMKPHLNSLLRWLGGGYVGHELLPDTLRQQALAAAHADEWSVGEGCMVRGWILRNAQLLSSALRLAVAHHADVICRGVYPWEHSSVPPTAAGPTSHELITKLRTHCNELQRAKEELELQAQERDRCVAYYQSRRDAISEAVQRTKLRRDALEAGDVVLACSSFAARVASNRAQQLHEQNYCEGLLLLLDERLQTATAQCAAAHAAFAVTDWSQAVAIGDPSDEYDFYDSEPDV